MQTSQPPPAGAAALAPQPGTIPSTEVVQQYLEDNEKLIHAILENMASGRLDAVAQYQQRLQQNLVFLASVADKQPQPPSQQPAVQPVASVPPPAAGPAQATASQAPQPVTATAAGGTTQGP